MPFPYLWNVVPQAHATLKKNKQTPKPTKAKPAFRAGVTPAWVESLRGLGLHWSCLGDPVSGSAWPGLGSRCVPFR